ncbi:MAG: methyltransferase [Pseudomonadota bacterium]
MAARDLISASDDVFDENAEKLMAGADRRLRGARTKAPVKSHKSSFLARLSDLVFARRNALLSSPAFQRAAAKFPLTRPLSRRKARQTFDLCAGFVYSQVLYACVETELFDFLKAAPKSIEEIAKYTGLPVDGAERLVRAAAALRLLEARRDQFGLGELGAALLGNRSVFAMVRHHQSLYADLQDPLARLSRRSRETELASFWGYAGSNAPDRLNETAVEPYSDLMAQTQAFIAQEVIAAYDFKRSNRVLDIGGGAGAFVSALADRHAHLSLGLFDLPSVTEVAASRFVANGYSNRIQVFGGSFFSDALPSGFDTISIVRILHDHDDPQALEILRAAHRALPPSGRVLIAEPMSKVPGAEAMGDAYFGIYLWVMGSGRPRTEEELTEMAQAAGFSRVKRAPTRTPILTQLLIAEK